MQLTAVFESWHIGDGNYPPLHLGELVRLSFELEVVTLAVAQGPLDVVLVDRGDAEYAGVGRVLRRYSLDGEDLTVVETEGLRFYVCRTQPPDVAVGALVEFAGTLLLDHYMWVEFLQEYEDPPDLFRNLRVARIRQVSIPERFVHRSDRGKSHPTRLQPKDFGLVEDLETMEGQPFDEEFYLLDLDDSGVADADVPLTFK